MTQHEKNFKHYGRKRRSMANAVWNWLLWTSETHMLWEPVGFMKSESGDRSLQKLIDEFELPVTMVRHRGKRYIIRNEGG